MNGWKRATTQGAYTTGYKPGDTRYRDAVQRVLQLTEAAYLESSEPAPHPVWWKRLLRRPYRRGDPAKFAATLHRMRKEQMP